MRLLRSMRKSITKGVWIMALFFGLSVVLTGCARKEEDKVFRVGILSGLDFFLDTVDGFKAKMSELGYREGTDILYLLEKSNFEPERERVIINRFIANDVDLILTFPTEVSILAKELTQNSGIPVLFANANIEGLDLVDSIRDPGGNITGVRYPGPDLAIKRFEIMNAIVPDAKRYWVPYQRGYPIVDPQMDVLRPAASSLGITLIEYPADNPGQLKYELDRRVQAGVIDIDAILFIAEPLAVTPEAFKVIGEFAYEHKIPVGGALMEADGYKSIFGVSTQNAAVGQQAAVLADKIFRGAEAGSLPVESAESYFHINYKVARDRFGILIPEGLLNQADEIVP